MYYSSHLFLAQEGSRAASEVIQQSLQLSQNTTESWKRIWDAAIDPNAVGLWTALVSFAGTLSALCVIYLTLKYAGELNTINSWSKIFEMTLWPLTVVVFLGGNGRLLAAVVRLIRGIGYQQVANILKIQLAGVTFQEAINQVRLNGLAMQRIQQVYSECVNLTGQELIDCWQNKQAEAETMLSELGAVANISPAQNFLDVILGFTAVGGIQEIGSFIEGGFTQVLQDRLIPLIQTILYTLQWAFVNLLETALLLTAMFAPIALALSILPLAGKPIVAWGSGMISLIAAQMGYNILVGVMAVVLVETPGDVAEAATDLGFLMFASVFSPILALLIAGGGGIALYQGISRRVGGIVMFATDALASVASLAVLSFKGR